LPFRAISFASRSRRFVSSLRRCFSRAASLTTRALVVALASRRRSPGTGVFGPGFSFGFSR